MKARLPEAAGGRPGPAGRSGPASFSGPSSRTKAGDAAGAGTPVSGALGAALTASLLAAAALLLAPGGAWGCANSGTVSSSQDFSCTNAAYPTSIRRVVDSNANLTIRVPGGTGTGGTATVITGEAHWPGIDIDASDNSQTGNYAIYAGTSGAINIVDDTGSGNASRGIRILQDGSGTATVDVGSQVTMGSSSSRMRQHGIYVRSSGSGGAVTVTNAGTVYASFEGIDVKHDGPGTTTVTHSGTVNALNHGIWVRADGTGPLIVTSSGGVTVTNANQQGIRMEAGNNGAAMTLTATGGTITTPGQGIYMESRGTGAVTILGTAASAPTQSGPTITSSASHGIHVHKSGSSATAGDVSITTTGGSITPAGTGRFHGIYVQDHALYTGSVAIDNAADITAGDHAIRVERLGAGDISITHSGGLALSRTRSGIFVRGGDNLAGDIDIDVTGGTVQAGSDSGSPAIRLTGRGDGDIGVTIAAGATAISHKAAGVFAILSSAAADDSQVEIIQGGGILGRSGVAVAILKHATAQTVAPRAETAQPMIDVAWTGTFAAGTTAQTAPEGSDLLTATSEAVAFIYARDAEAGKASGGAWGGPVGIEAQVMSWSALAVEVAEGDDPGAFANAAAQQAAVPTGATASDNAYVKQFRAVLESDAFVVAPSLLMAIGTTATTSAADLTDAQIVTYLRVDNAGRRTLLRNVLAQNLSDKEKAVLSALSTGDSDGLTAALDDTEAGFSNPYKTAVRALLNRYNVGNVHVAMTGGSIDSRGDGIRAYYATPNANNGAISVSVAAGTTVTGARAGIWVANAGGDVTVSNSGTVTGGTYGIYAANAGAIEVTVAAGASVTGAEDGVYVANAGEGLMLAKKYTYGFGMDDGATADDPVAVTHGEGADRVALLDQLVTVAGTVTGGTGAAVHLSGGGAVIVEDGGKAHAGASGVAILVNDPGPALAHIDGEVKGGAGGAAAVHLTGGGSVIVGLNGKVEANGATRTIQGGGTDETMVTVTLVTDGMVVYREDAEEAHAPRMVGAYDPSSVTNVRFREHRNGVPTGYSTSLTVTASGMLDPRRLDPRLCPGDQPRDAEGNCPSSPGDPGTGDPGTGDPGTGDPGTGDPGTGDPGTGDPGTGDPGTGDPGTGDPGTGDPGTGDPGTGDPGTGDPGTGDPGTGGPGAGGPGAPTPTFSCEDVERMGDRRCRLYEALPSMLVAMNALPSYAERTSAARDGNGGWARVEASRGEWQAKTATMETTSTPLAYDHRRNAVRAGVDFHAGESARVGVSVHALGGKAEMGGVGDVELDGMGGGLSATWRAGEFYVDAQAAVTLYDVDVESYTHGKMSKKDVYGAGYGLGVDVGRRMGVGGMMVTPRAGLEWSKVELDDFVDMERAGSPEARARVSVEEADSVKGRVGVMVEAEMGSGGSSGRVFASVDVEQEFSEETEVKVGEELLKTEVRPTAVRVGLGGAFAVAEDVVVRATGGFRTSGSGTSGYGGGLELQMRF